MGQEQADEKENEKKADEEKKAEGETEAKGDEKKDENTEATKPAENGWQSMSGGWQAMEKEAPKFPTDEEMKQFNFGPYSKTMTMEDCQIMEKEQGPLPTQPGLGALAELRRIKWYQHIGLNTPYLSDVVRLFRGLAIRESSWLSFRILCPWTICLILETLVRYDVEANEHSTKNLSPARVFHMVLDAIGKGFRFPVKKVKKEEVKEEAPEPKEREPKSAPLSAEAKEKEMRRKLEEKRRKRKDEIEKRDRERNASRQETSRRESKRYTHRLVDPCEQQKDYDALAHISSQRKADIRACAKYALDLVERKQICLLLGTPRVEELDKFNHRSGEGPNVERGLTRGERKEKAMNNGVFERRLFRGEFPPCKFGLNHAGHHGRRDHTIRYRQERR